MSVSRTRARANIRVRLLHAVLIAVSSGCAAAAPELMSFEVYNEIDHPVPYVLALSTSTGELLYYGADHVYDAAHPQIADLQARWDQFRPTYALNEGGNPPVLDTLEETVGRQGESALVRWLAKRDGVPVDTLNPTRAAETEAALSRFSAEQLKLYFVLRQVAQQRRRSATFRVPDLEAEVTRVLGLLSRVPGLAGPPSTVTDVEERASRLLPQLTAWQEVEEVLFDPAVIPPLAWTNELSDFLNAYADAFMIQRNVTKLGEGHRVFAVVGASHVVMQESLLRWQTRSEQPTSHD